MGELHYRKDTDLTWSRIRRGEGFAYVNTKGKRVSRSALKRISKLSIPPGWKEVTVSPDPKSYIQAIGYDKRGRKQYIYHPQWVKRNQEKKFEQMVAFGERLPGLRQTVSSHMRERQLTHNRVVATIIWLLEHTFIRVGNKNYAQENHSYGLTTMREKHVEIRGSEVSFSFTGKSGVQHELDVNNPSVARTVRQCIELPGYELFAYLDEFGNKRIVDSSAVNEYLKTHTGVEFSAKDFRTWGGSVLAGESFYKKGEPQDQDSLKTIVSEVIAIVSEHLGNTKKVCQTYYIHPAIISSYERKILVPHFARSYGRKISGRFTLAPEEYATWSLIKDS